VPVEAHIKEHPAWFKRFDAVWTPTVLLLDSEGKERVRLEGYLTHGSFDAWLRCGLGHLAFARKRFADAERWFDEVATRHADSHFGAEATYYRGVARYSATRDHAVLKALAPELQQKYPGTIWAEKSIPWE
jgi:hypothetical protein